MHYSLWVGSELPPQAKEFSCVIFMSDGKVAQEMDRWFVLALAVTNTNLAIMPLN